MTERHPYDGGIAGWTYPAQVAWLRARARESWRIVEVGAFKGRVTHALASSTPGRVWSIDHFLGADPLDADDVTWEIEQAGGPDAVFREFMQNCGRFRNLTLMRMSSAEAWRRLGHLTFDFVWIDASHNYASVRDDILRWRALLAPGGLLAGHDAEYPGVSRALVELVPNANVEYTRAMIAGPGGPYEDHGPPGSGIWWTRG